MVARRVMLPAQPKLSLCNQTRWKAFFIPKLMKKSVLTVENASKFAKMYGLTKMSRKYMLAGAKMTA